MTKQKYKNGRKKDSQLSFMVQPYIFNLLNSINYTKLKEKTGLPAKTKSDFCRHAIKELLKKHESNIVKTENCVSYE